MVEFTNEELKYLGLGFLGRGGGVGEEAGEEESTTGETGMELVVGVEG